MKVKYLTPHRIHSDKFLTQKSAHKTVGASVSFFGIVRDENKGRKVTHLFYESYESLAETMIADLIAKALRIWPILEVKVLHRIGKVKVGQVAVAIEVLAVHRDEAYRASRFLIDEIKAKVPIWKKEYFEDGIFHWGGCEDHAHVNEMIA